MDIDESIVIKYLQNDCTEDEIGLINKWLSEKEENKRELFLMEMLYKAKNRDRYSDPQFFQTEKDKLFDRIQREEANIKQSLVRKFWQYAAAAAIAIMLTVGISLYRINTHSLQTLTADNGKVKKVVLPDGTRVWLNHSAQLSYPKQFKGKTRTVHLEGEGYFEVSKNAEYPFIVETEEMEVKVLGTVFNISNSSEADISTITLLEGEVQVRGYDDGGMVTLLPGQRAELNHTTHRLLVKEDCQAALAAVWHNGLIPFRQASIEEIGKTLERLYDVHVILAPDIPANTYSGVLKNQDSIATALHLLKNSSPIEYEIKGKDVYIRRR
ncbi:MAG: FecR domain-containing protein [Candidatus Symbiothrix sp.]|jgi:ferric-dicitrate binding protein FerR (iron transport regulator)|nr:FecR domain-containing protein [Candidatus Symbiothrix sp.]